MRIIGGAWRGRTLVAPAGQGTRPTADRVRQALFDRLAHAPWAAGVLEGAVVLDAFAGTGALGLEALSRGAARAVFIERERAALAALRANITACRAEGRCLVVAGDACLPPPAGDTCRPPPAGDACRPPPGEACGLVLLDPPYGQGLVSAAVAALGRAGWIAPGALIVAESGAESGAEIGAEKGREEAGPGSVVAEWAHGAARMVAWRSAV